MPFGYKVYTEFLRILCSLSARMEKGPAEKARMDCKDAQKFSFLWTKRNFMWII